MDGARARSTKEVVREARKAMKDGKVETARGIVRDGFPGELGARTSARLTKIPHTVAGDME